VEHVIGLLPLAPLLAVVAGVAYGCLRVGRRYFVKRLAGLVVALWGASLITFSAETVSARLCPFSRTRTACVWPSEWRGPTFRTSLPQAMSVNLRSRASPDVGWASHHAGAGSEAVGVRADASN